MMDQIRVKMHTLKLKYICSLTEYSIKSSDEIVDRPNTPEKENMLTDTNLYDKYYYWFL